MEVTDKTPKRPSLSMKDTTANWKSLTLKISAVITGRMSADKFGGVRPRLFSLTTDWENVLMFPETSKATYQHSMTIRPKNINARQQTTFCTGSTYVGQWNTLTMEGYGCYTMPHNVRYEGELEDGMFHGEGTLFFPWGSSMEGTWHYGRMIRRKYIFSDGLVYDENNWPYCKMPDRRFYSETLNGLKPAGRSQITDQHPPRPIPDGCYDVGEGIYNPKNKCILDYYTGQPIRTPAAEEEKWIKRHCRKAWDENVGFRPDLYENWFEEEGDTRDSSVTKEEKTKGMESEEEFEQEMDSCTL